MTALAFLCGAAVAFALTERSARKRIVQIVDDGEADHKRFSDFVGEAVRRGYYHPGRGWIEPPIESAPTS